MTYQWCFCNSNLTYHTIQQRKQTSHRADGGSTEKSLIYLKQFLYLKPQVQKMFYFIFWMDEWMTNG